MIFWRKKKIDWPFWVFGLITLGIIVSVGFLIFTLVTKPNVENRVETNAEFEANIQKIKEEVLSNYRSELDGLILSVSNKEEMSEIKTEVQRVFFASRVPQDYLDLHLQTWLKIDKLDIANFKNETLNLLKELRSQIN